MSSPSSPMIASSGARRPRISRIAASAARSAALTRSVDVDFVASTRSLPKRSSSSAPAVRAHSTATSSSSASSSLTRSPPAGGRSTAAPLELRRERHQQLVLAAATDELHADRQAVVVEPAGTAAAGWPVMFQAGIQVSRSAPRAR